MNLKIKAEPAKMNELSIGRLERRKKLEMPQCDY